MSVLAGCSQSVEEPRPDKKMIDVGGHRLATRIIGHGAPVVVFENGMIGRMEAWKALQDRVAMHTKTLTYERAGQGESEIGPSPRSAQQIAHELRALLTNANIPAPFLLVGHSAGGMFVRVFSSIYADEIAGMVLVDPATEDAYDYWRTKAPAHWDGFESAVERQVGEPPPGWYGQWRALPLSIKQARESWPLPDAPTVVFTAMQPIPGEWMLENASRMNVWLNAHRELVAQIPDSEHIVVHEAHHGSILGEEILARKILNMVESLRRSNRPE